MFKEIVALDYCNKVNSTLCCASYGAFPLMAHPLPLQEEAKYILVKTAKLVIKIFSHGYLQHFIKVLHINQKLKKNSFVTFFYLQNKNKFFSI
jgi:hypothetical protein